MGTIYFAARQDWSEFFDLDKHYRTMSLTHNLPKLWQPLTVEEFTAQLLKDELEYSIDFDREYLQWIAETFINWTRGEPVWITDENDDRLGEYDERKVTGSVIPDDYVDGVYSPRP